METVFLNKLIQTLPLAYAYHKVQIDQNDQVEDYVFVDINEAFEKMTGLRADTIKGKRVTEVIPGIREDSFNWIEFYGNIATTGVSKEFTQYTNALGRWYKVTAFSPEMYYFVTVFQDITPEMEQKLSLEKQEEQLRSALRDYEIIFDGTLDPMSLFELHDGKYVYLRINAVHRKVTGLSLPDIRGRGLVDVYGHETGGKLQQYLDLCVQSRTPLNYEMTYDFPNGVRKWATTLIPVFDADNVQYVVASSRDITEVETLRQENVELAERLEVMFQNHMAVMIIVDPFTGRIKDANPSACNFYGYSKDELVEMSIQDINLLAPDVVEQRRIEALKESRRYFVFPHRLKNGDVRMVDVYTSPIRRGGTMELFSIIFDVTDREMLRENLYREKELLRITLKSIGDGVVATDINGLITLQNESSDAIAGWTESEVKGRPFDEVYVLKNEMTGVVVENPVEKVLRTGKTVGLANHTVLVNKEGRHIPIADSAAPIQDAAGDMFGVVMVFRDVSQEKVHQDMILYLSYHDELTGLYNRRYAEEAIRRLNESYQSPLAIIMGDLNGLKITNDVFGHKAGDELLKRTADILRKNCREEDIVARWGGDEFLLILPRTSAESARTIMNKIMADCASDGEELVKISIALGSAVKTGEEEMQSVLREAEEWMYHQKLLDDKSYKKAIVNTLLATLYEKSYETEKHDERMNKYCTAIGKELGLSAENLNELSLFAILHDIGKIGIPHDILQKPGPLTSEEQEEMRRHPEIGFRIAQNTPELSTVAKYILSHHERWDGFGYPQGLEGESIPLLCRILAVADAYDAMTNDRVYRKAVSKEAAIEEILRNAGTQFDPDVVRIFVGLIAQGDL
jgi:diguanylate cyclase (GGDEF)-like protein/PAS domain S-box-containing protein